MKAILVVDMPNGCDECQFCGYGGQNLEKYVCCLTKEHSESPHLVGCPLKPLPRKIDVDVKKIEDIMHTEFQMVDVIQDKIKAEIKLNTDKLIALGWNACIDEILGDTE